MRLTNYMSLQCGWGLVVFHSKSSTTDWVSKLKENSILCAQDGTQLYIARCDLEQWRDHFAQVNNTSFQLVSSVVDAVSEMAPDSSALFDECDDYLASVLIENEVREAVQWFKNKKPW